MKIHPPYNHYVPFRAPRNLFSTEYAIDASIIAYSGALRAAGAAASVGLGCETINTPLFQCLVLTNNAEPDNALVAFRGTLDNQKIGLADWRVDLETGKTSAGFHSGFWDAVSVLHDDLVPLLNGQHVVFTGHSLGAAMAAVAAHRFSPHCKSVQIVNFGQPKIGDQQAVDLLKGIPWNRYKHGGDIITDVPLGCMGYVHGGNQIQLPQVPHHFWQYFSHEKPFFFPVDLWDHIPTLYAKRIWERE